MLDRTLCIQKQVVWLAFAVVVSLASGLLVGRLTTDDWDVDLALAVSSVMFALLSTIQMVLIRMY